MFDIQAFTAQGLATFYCIDTVMTLNQAVN